MQSPFHPVLGASLFLAVLPCLCADEPPSAPAAGRPVVDVAFVLDTTGSMGGLIEGAKKKIWSIANAILTGEPRPEVRLALVGYRDQGDAYVTRRNDFSDNIDVVYDRLRGFAAEGGGDTPEYVEQALKEAIDDLAWSPKASLRVIYLVGDAPPHEYEDGLDLPSLCRRAVEKGIIINTIRCGGAEDTGRVWDDIARRSEGRFLSIDQSGGMVAVATPFDRELGDWNDRLVDTRLVYGTEEYQSAAGRRLEGQKDLAEDAKAGCAGWNDSNGRLDRQDLLDACGSEPVVAVLARIPAKDLPEALQGKTPEEQKALIEKLLAQRREISEQIAGLNRKRDEFVRAEDAKRVDAKDSFDAKAFEALKEQAAKHGITYK